LILDHEGIDGELFVHVQAATHNRPPDWRTAAIEHFTDGNPEQHIQ
jgi:hypothetical protein